MRCAVNGKVNAVPVDLVNEVENSNLRQMAINTNVLSDVGGQLQFGKRQDMFWLIMAVIVAVVLSGISLTRKRKRRR